MEVKALASHHGPQAIQELARLAGLVGKTGRARQTTNRPRLLL
jgi:hypothetical protein